MPHMTVADNIAIVPHLLKWPKSKIAQRVDELLDMVGLDPSVYRDRFPRELSGGQQQRVGVARGLAADPPVVLMDEPFGAVDPITRTRLQDELVNIQSDLGKTIVCVTHDIDEAVKLGHRILILQPGAQIAQYDTPENILAAPANEFVEDFIGSGSTLKQLSLKRVEEMDLWDPAVARIGEPADEVVARARAAGEDTVVVLDDKDRPREWVTLRQVQRHRVLPEPTVELSSVVGARSTLSDAMSAMLVSSHGGAMVTRRGKFIGVLLYDTVNDYVRTLKAKAGDSEQ
ncbi:ATP-binding cassette domain-containing protein [Corynebacterium confusum]|uniref:ATP-binding cassette domain-containing protein n=1 Tax=Corynebacterium confusum TaxID=71254 RepID=UPI003F49775B